MAYSRQAQADYDAMRKINIQFERHSGETFTDDENPEQLMSILSEIAAIGDGLMIVSLDIFNESKNICVSFRMDNGVAEFQVDDGTIIRAGKPEFMVFDEYGLRSIPKILVSFYPSDEVAFEGSIDDDFIRHVRLGESMITVSEYLENMGFYNKAYPDVQPELVLSSTRSFNVMICSRADFYPGLYSKFNPHSN